MRVSVADYMTFATRGREADTAFLKNWLRKLKECVPARLKAAIVRGLRRVTTRHLTSWFLHCGYHFK